MPACCCRQRRNAGADGRKCSIRKERVGRDRGSVVSASGTGLSDKRCAVRREPHGKRAGAGTWVDHDRSQCAVDLNMEGVDVIGQLFSY